MLEELTFGFPILLAPAVFPLVGAMLLWLLDDEDLIKNAAVGISALELILAGIVLLRFVPGSKPRCSFPSGSHGFLPWELTTT